MRPDMTMVAMASFLILYCDAMRRMASARRPASCVWRTSPIFTPAIRTSSPSFSSFSVSKPAMMV
jgi:hypothetical protein